jgi:hypothetical protein
MNRNSAAIAAQLVMRWLLARSRATFIVDRVSTPTPTKDSVAQASEDEVNG